MAVDDIITAARYNNAQGRVAAIIGNGSGNEGYGQTVTSEQVSSNVIINASHVNALYTDLRKIFIHQTGGLPNIYILKFFIFFLGLIFIMVRFILVKNGHLIMFVPSVPSKY